MMIVSGSHAIMSRETAEMPPLDERKSIAKKLRRFRLEIAQVILRNDSYRTLIQSDIQSGYEIAELCDDYALQLFVLWLSTKYGCGRYGSVIESTDDQNGRLHRLALAWDGEYPFVSVSLSDLCALANSKALEILETSLQPSLYLLGSLYEQIIEEPLVFDAAGEVYMQKVRSRQLSGQFYTPSWIVKYCFDSTLQQDLSNLISSLKAESISPSSARLQQSFVFRLLDPACGTGNFLLGAVQWLNAGGLSGPRLINAAEHSLYGIEIDGRAASICRVGMLLSLSEAFEILRQSSGDEAAERRWYQVLNALRRNIQVGDSVLAASVDHSCPFPWKFDLVATNPPYISYGSRNQPALSASASRYLRNVYPEAAEYKIRLHSLFQDIAVRFAADGARVVLFLPDAFLTGGYYQKLRAMLLRKVQIESLTELPEEVIGDATVGRWCVARYRVHRALVNSAYDVELCTFVATGDNCASGTEMPPVGAASKLHRYSLPLSILVSPEKRRFRLLYNDLDRDIWMTMDQLSQLGSVLTGHTGIRALSGQNSIKSDRKLGHTWQKGITSGSCVQRHTTNWSGEWLNIDSSLLYGGGFNPEVVARPKLLVRQTADRIIAGLDLQGLYHLNNVHSLSPSSKADLQISIDLSFFDGLINSSLWLYLYQSKTREGGRALAQIDIEMLESMPLPLLRPEACQMIAALICEMREICGSADRMVNDSESESLLFLLERSVDRLVYDLYGLCDAHVSWIEATCSKAQRLNGDLPDVEMVKALVGSLQSYAMVSQEAQAGGRN